MLDSKVYPYPRGRFVKLGLLDEARTFNLPHVTVKEVADEMNRILPNGIGT